MALNWQELLQKSPREIVISGPKHAEVIDKEKKLDDTLFRIVSVNFLEVSKTSLNVLSPKIKELDNLLALMLYDNKLTSLPKEIGQLRKLKTLDLSNNLIQSLPEEISQLTELQSINLIKNKITKLPKDLSKWKNLICIKISHNNFHKFPPGLLSSTFEHHLTEIHASDNQISNLPSSIKLLPALRVLDLANNKIEHVPGELADCAKIKTLQLQNNPIKDVRLHKMAEKNPTKEILKYVAKSCPKGGANDDGPKGNKDARKKQNSTSSEVATTHEIGDTVQA